MDEKQIADLAAYLVTLGFKGGKLEDDLRKEISFNLPSFKVHHHIPWGEEQMFFEFQFNKDQQFGAYRLVEYKAVHRREVDIEHAVVEDIDTRELEEAMKKINWLEYFDKGREVTDVFSKQLIELTMPRLIRISYGDSATGRRIQQELMFKYWPKDVYKAHMTPAEGDLSRRYEEEQIFPATEYGTCNANLAFHLLSGRLEELFEQLYPFEIDGYLGKDLHSYLEDRLSGKPEKFNITCSGNEPEGFIEFVIPVELINGWYWNGGYTATLTMHPEISHRIIGNTDSRELEEKMMNDEIETVTYKKWFSKYSEQKAHLQRALNQIRNNNQNHWNRLSKKLDLLTNLNILYDALNIRQKHMLLNGVFDRGLVYSDGAYRTPWLHPALSHNQLKMKEKGLLYVEQPNDIWRQIPLSSP
ncbi:MAG TPA: hypothetical protein VIR29_14960 [Anseongella sp.]